MPSKQDETFTKEQIQSAIKAFIEFGEQSLCPDSYRDKHDTTKCHLLGHHGYFSNGGFAARALKYHLNTFEK